MGSVGKFFKNLINKNCKNANKEIKSLKFFSTCLNIKRTKLQWNGFFWNYFRYECLGNQRIAATFCSVLVNTFTLVPTKESGANKKTLRSRKNYVLKREFASEIWETDS